MKPLRALDRAIAQLGDVQLGCRVAEYGDREFRRLMRHFNRMSSTLAHLHASMQQQVEIKSRQIMRSEQLASVGYLAAGLAHEINNPLGIIAGYAEQSLRKLKARDGGAVPCETARKVERTLEIICEEAFRCRDITRDLLVLAQPADAEAKTIALLPLTERAVTLVSALPIARDHEIVICTEEAPDELICCGHASQLLQVFINLLTNALEACAPQRGRVLVAFERPNDRVAVTVTDNGCGMTKETLAHAFDPFFTDKPRRGLTGCGLGLAVSHAIIERHEGRLYAHSDGPDRGSAFSVELPAVPSPIARLHSEPTCLTRSR